MRSRTGTKCSNCSSKTPESLGKYFLLLGFSWPRHKVTLGSAKNRTALKMAEIDPPGGTELIAEGLVAALGKTVGLDFPAERLPVIAQRLRELHAIAADLDGLDLAEFEPAARFDASWPAGGAR